MSSINLQFEPELLKPLIRQVIEETLAALSEATAKVNGQIACSEQKAAELLDLKVHQLRDARLRGDIQAFTVTGQRIRYRREDIVAYLVARPWTEEGKRRSGRAAGVKMKGAAEDGVA